MAVGPLSKANQLLNAGDVLERQAFQQGIKVQLLKIVKQQKEIMLLKFSLKFVQTMEYQYFCYWFFCNLFMCL